MGEVAIDEVADEAADEVPEGLRLRGVLQGDQPTQLRGMFRTRLCLDFVANFVRNFVVEMSCTKVDKEMRPKATISPDPTTPRLLALELWGLGDLALAVPFLRAAARRYRVDLLAKPHAAQLTELFCPEVRVIPFQFPWTAFAGKYRFWGWPWADFARLFRALRANRYEVGASARPDPRDHLVLRAAGAKERYGFRHRSRGLINHALPALPLEVHRFTRWKAVAEELDLALALPGVSPRTGEAGRVIVVHTGAARAVRVWPLDRFATLVERWRRLEYEVRVLCDPDQADWWHRWGEPQATSPRTVTELVAELREARWFVANDSGPGHIAALAGVPTFTVFGPQLPESFTPIHPQAAWIEGAPCPHKPCFDACRFDTPRCMLELDVERVWDAANRFVRKGERDRLPSPRE